MPPKVLSYSSAPQNRQAHQNAASSRAGGSAPKAAKSSSQGAPSSRTFSLQTGSVGEGEESDEDMVMEVKPSARQRTKTSSSALYSSSSAAARAGKRKAVVDDDYEEQFTLGNDHLGGMTGVQKKGQPRAGTKQQGRTVTARDYAGDKSEDDDADVMMVENALNKVNKAPPNGRTPAAAGASRVSQSEKERRLERRLEQLTQERDELTRQFEELRDLRTSEPERTLMEYKQLMNDRHRAAQDLIVELKNRIATTEKRNRELVASSASLRDGEQERRAERERHAAELAAKDRKIHERDQEISALHSDLVRLERASARPQAPPTDTGARRGGAGTAGGASANDEDTQRKLRLYEDLTGLAIQGVLPAEDPKFRKFSCFFSAPDHRDLIFNLEESRSERYNAYLKTNQSRDDVIYQPKFDPAHDVEVRDQLPPHFRDHLRFERGSGLKFLEKLRQGLRKK